MEDNGVAYKSTTEKLKKVGGITIIFPKKENWEIVSCIFEKNADIGELLPVNENLAGKSIAKIAIKNGQKVLYFEGELPTNIEYNNI